jgi:AraC family transcriptional regulator of adaptative response/methylated-DNA-[protein]-cysteine methyltransferase
MTQNESRCHFDNTIIRDISEHCVAEKIKKENIHNEAVDFINKGEGKIDLHIKGTDFQINVWKELLKIKSGETSSYGEIARKINKPNAFRAAGTAIGKNPVAYIIPCHRVTKSNGEIGNYMWGVDKKREILKREV